MARTFRLAAAVTITLGVLVTCGLAAPARAGRPATGPPAKTWTVDAVRIEPLVADGAVEAAGIGTYRGSLRIGAGPGGLAVVNDVGFEDYVKGISEVPSAWPIEALKAQAIAARTYALWELRRNVATDYKAAGADICATQACQVYTGVAKGRAQDGARWIAAAEATKDQALWWRDAPIVAKYSSSNGGESVAGGQPYLRAAPDPDDVYSPLHRWRVTVAPDALAGALGMAGRRVTAIQRVGDEILVTAHANPDDPEESPAHATLPVLDFRDRVNVGVPAPAGMPRTLPTVRFAPSLAADGGSVTFDGRGWGHGIGLSQWGAFGKAVRGMKAPDILAAYYAGLRPVTLPPGLAPATVKVAVAIGRAAPLVVGGDRGAVRLVSSTGEVIAHATEGRWRVQRPKKAAGSRSWRR